jgi:hypothetical protein
MRSRKLRGWSIAYAIAVSIGIGGPVWAQDADTAGCEDGCVEAEDLCFEACESADDAVECEESCAASLDMCLESCE